MKLFKQTEPYAQAEIAEQVRIIDELQREYAKARTKAQQERFNTSIDTAQEVLLFMQDENNEYYDARRSSKPKH